MMRVPTLVAIDAAELRLVQSRRKLRLSVERSRSALRSAVARPSTLLLVALVSGIWAFLLVRRRRPAVTAVPNSTASTIAASSRGLVQTLVSMYGVRVLSFALKCGATARKQSESRVNADRPGTSAARATATTVVN